MVKIEVRTYKDGTKRYEYRHLNDLKLAHPESLAAPAVRPKLGRPSVDTSSHSAVPKPTDAQPSPAPSPFLSPRKENKQTPSPSTGRDDAKHGNISHETSISTGPPSTPPFPDRPVRSTRNPAPYYVDSIQLSSLRPWSASQTEIDNLNRSIGGYMSELANQIVGV